jgi:hypothetical protein
MVFPEDLDLERKLVVPAYKGSHLVRNPVANVIKGSIVKTDGYKAYRNLFTNYDHRVVNHRSKEIACGIYNHTTINEMENYWSNFKWMFLGVNHKMSGKHMNKYLAARSFRYCERNISEWERLIITFTKSVKKEFTYGELIARCDEQGKRSRKNRQWREVLRQIGKADPNEVQRRIPSNKKGAARPPKKI